MMTEDQLSRAALIAESRHIDLATAQELVYLRDLHAPKPVEDERVREIRKRHNQQLPSTATMAEWRDIDYLLSLLPVQPALQDYSMEIAVGKEWAAEKDAAERIVSRIADNDCLTCKHWSSDAVYAIAVELATAKRTAVQPAASTPTDSSDVERWKRELTEAGWVAETAIRWRSPGGGLWRGPYGAWVELQRQKHAAASMEAKGRLNDAQDGLATSCT